MTREHHEETLRRANSDQTPKPLHPETHEPEREQVDEPILQWFEYSHLPPQLHDIVQWFRNVANTIVTSLPRNPERTVALRKLLEAKDAAVRARLFK